MRGDARLRGAAGKEARFGRAKSALQIAPALLYYWKLKLTLLALRRHLFVTIALVRGNPREQVSEGLLINCRSKYK